MFLYCVTYLLFQMSEANFKNTFVKSMLLGSQSKNRLTIVPINFQIEYCHNYDISHLLVHGEWPAKLGGQLMKSCRLF